MDLGSDSSRPKLFNCITVALVTGWVVLVAVVAEFTGVHPVAEADTVAGFVQTLLR